MSRNAFGFVVVFALCGGVALSLPGAEGAKPDAATGERLTLAREVYAEMMERANHAEGYDIEDLELWSQNLLGAELSASANPADRTAARKAHVERTTDLERLTKSYARAGQGKNSDALAAEFYRKRAEAELAGL